MVELVRPLIFDETRTDDKNPNITEARNNLLGALHTIYPVYFLKEYSFERCKEVLRNSASSSENLYDDGGSNAHFVDREVNSFYYDFSNINFNDYSEVLNHFKSFLSKERGGDNTIENIIANFNSKGNKITHVIISEERYGGDDSSVWRAYDRATMYELVDFKELLLSQKLVIGGKRKKEFNSICEDLKNNGKTIEYVARWGRD